MKLPEMIISIMYYKFNCYLEISNTFKSERNLLSSNNRDSCNILLFGFIFNYKFQWLENIPIIHYYFFFYCIIKSYQWFSVFQNFNSVEVVNIRFNTSNFNICYIFTILHFHLCYFKNVVNKHTSSFVFRS